MCCIPSTWHDSSKVNITVEEFFQNRKKTSLVSDCWTIVSVTVEQSGQWLLNNCDSDCWTIRPVLNNQASDCWTIVPVTFEQSCQRLSNIRASDCWRIMPVTVEESCWRRFNNPCTDCWTVKELYQRRLKNCASDCWRIVPVTVDELCQWLLNSLTSCFFLSFQFTLAKSLPVFRVNTSIIINCFNLGSQLT